MNSQDTLIKILTSIVADGGLEHRARLSYKRTSLIGNLTPSRDHPVVKIA
jgi:hypothetical protein